MNDLIGSFPPGQNVEWMKNERRLPESTCGIGFHSWKRWKERLRQEESSQRVA